MQAQTLLSKHMLNDVTLTWDRSQSCVARLLFGEIKPRRVELSPDMHLLLVLGSHYHGALSLVVYRIQPQSPHLLPIFSDSALAVLDATFAPDSRSLLIIPTASPSHIWIVPLSADAAPIVDFDPTHSSAPPANGPSVAAFSRLTGSIGVIGPALDCFGYLHEPRHIASYGGVSSYMRAPPPADDIVVNAPQYHLATWGDECDGSFCLWSVWSSDADGASAVPLFRVYPQMLVPSVRNAAWLDDPTTPKNSICMMKFSRTTPELLAVVRRENYRRAQDNGIALQTMRLDEPDGIVMGVSRIVSSVQSSAHVILQATWTLPMLLGTQPCAAVVVDDNGVCEINQQVYGAQFLERHEFFHNSVRCIAQVDRYRRLWLDKHGRLRMLHIEPRQAVPQAHSWGAMFDFGSNDNLPLRLLAAKIGYAIKDHREDASVSLSAKIEAIYMRSVKKAVLSSEPIAPSAVQQGEAFECVHLYRCFNCGEVLLRPLVCSCGTAAFCGRVCQSRQRIRSTMSKATVTPQQHQKNIKELEEIVSKPPNDRCADCNDKGPRWATINIGAFICIRCSGIHRNMGVHITQVRSINMDKWLPDQLQRMRDRGNDWIAAHYEHNMPSGVKPTAASSTAETERFIRQKYEEKRWYREGASVAKPADHSAPAAAPVAAAPKSIAAALPDLFADAAPQAAPPRPPSAAGGSTGGGSLLDAFFGGSAAPIATSAAAPAFGDFSNGHANGGGFADFGSFASAPAAAPAAAADFGAFQSSAPAAPVPASTALSPEKLASLYSLTPAQPTMLAATPASPLQPTTSGRGGSTPGKPAPNYNVHLGPVATAPPTAGPNYGAPAAAMPIYGYGAPAAAMPGYGAPGAGYGAPAGFGGFGGAPAGFPAGGYGAVPNYGAGAAPVAPNYGGLTPNYGGAAPMPNYGAAPAYGPGLAGGGFSRQGGGLN